MSTRLDSANITEDATVAVGNWPGGPGTFQVTGTLGSGTYTLQYSADGGTTYGTVGTDTTKTDSTPGNFTLGPGKLQVVVGSSTNPDAYARVRPIRTG